MKPKQTTESQKVLELDRTTITDSATGKDLLLGEELPGPLQSEAFADAWYRWWHFRKGKHVSLTVHAIQEQLKFLNRLGEDQAIVSIEQSIRNSWTGLFEVKGMFKRPTSVAENMQQQEAENTREAKLGRLLETVEPKNTEHEQRIRKRRDRSGESAD